MTEGAKEVARGNVAVVIGGGTGRTKATQEVILDYLTKINLPVVIDADAIHALAKTPEIVSQKPFLITPHTYEFFILTTKPIYKLEEEERIKSIREEAERLKTTIILKGATDIISNGKEVALNKTGSQWMTKGGCGDTLAGIAGALMARGVDPFVAGQAAAFINGKAGELAAKRKKEGLLATELIEAIPEVLG
jgi:NAD(P)H-hydrate epimerase